MSAGTSHEAQAILDQLVEIERQIEGYMATVAMLKLDRLRLQTELRMSGYRPEQPEQPGLPL